MRTLLRQTLQEVAASLGKTAAANRFAHHEATVTSMSRTQHTFVNVRMHPRIPEATSKQDAAYTRQFHEALNDVETKSKQTAAYIHHFQARPKSCRSHLKPKVDKILRAFINSVNK